MGLWMGLCWTSADVLTQRAIWWSYGRRVPVFGSHVLEYLEMIDNLPKEKNPSLSKNGENRL